MKIEGSEVVVTTHPSEPIMVACDCDVDPWLRAVESRNPQADAASVIQGDKRFLWGESGIGLLVPGWQSDDEPFDDQLEIREMPYDAESVSCFEGERLEQRARAYAETFNRLVLDSTRHP
ncbi:hypothetical protein K2X89_07130 [Myxococcota bacterium]|nr:hypothetical protein [Myxococcota bacterium]